MNVPAHTSKVGAYSHAYWISYQQRLRSLTALGKERAWGEASKKPTTSLSYKTDTVKSDGVVPTAYSRKVSRLYGESFHVTSPSHEARGSDSRVWFNLMNSPHGSAWNSPTVPVPATLENGVIQEVMQDILDLRANILEDIGQARQAVTMLWDILKTIVKLYLLARNRQWRKLRRTLRGMGYRPAKKVANSWLMYYYGIRPLISTFDAICSSYGPKKRVIKKSRKAQQPVDPYGFATGTNVEISGKAKFRVKCGMTVGLKADSSLSYWHSLGLTGDYDADITVTTWALIPYSFVVDWIIPVEQFLRTRRFTSIVEFHTGYVARTLMCEADITGDPVGMNGGPYSSRVSAQVKALHFQRVPHLYTPPSGLAVNQSLSTTNMFNALALIIQRR